MQIKFVDLAAQNLEIRERVAARWMRDPFQHRLRRRPSGRKLRAGVRRISRREARRRASRNGTDALRLALLALGVGPGDEVITDADDLHRDRGRDRADRRAADLRRCRSRDRATSSPARAAQLSGIAAAPASAAQLRAIVPVHLYGLPAAMRELKEIAAEFSLQIVEDACQAHGASRHDCRRDGDARERSARRDASASIPAKISAPGAMAARSRPTTTNCAARIRLLRNHGRLSHYAHQDLRLQLAPRFDPGRGAARQAGKARRMERAPARSRRGLSRIARGADLVLPIRARGVRIRPITCSSFAAAKRDAIRHALLQQEHRVRNPLSGPAASAAGAAVTSAIEPMIFRRAKRSRTRALAADASASDRRRSACRWPRS